MKTSLIENHREDNLRSGEGSIVELRDGRLLLHYSHFEGAADHDPAYIAQRISADGGQTWGERTVFTRRPEGALNVMSASLLRLADGRIGSVVLLKWRNEKCVPQWCTSSDDGQTWSAPRPINDEEEYFVVNNERLVQLADGTLILPFARHGNLFRDDQKLRAALNADCGLFYSLDGGETWVRSPHTVRHEDADFRRPLFEGPNQTEFPEVAEVLEKRYGVFQEPGVVELADGRIFMHARSLYAMYYCTTPGVDTPWGPRAVLEGYNIPCSPQSIRRLPGGKRLVMLYNDRATQAWGGPEFQLRTPLSVAVSDDEGQSWQRLGALTTQERNYCYFSFLFIGGGERFVITAYESAVGVSKDGITPRRRNLASYQVWSGPTSLFWQEKIEPVAMG